MSFWDGVFYRLWRSVPANGFPDRSFVLVAVMQFVWAMLPLLIAGNLTIKWIALPIYPDIIGGAAIGLFAVLTLYCGIRYTEKRYRYRSLPLSRIFCLCSGSPRSSRFPTV